MRGGFGITQRAVVTVERDLVNFTKIPKPVGLMAWIPPPHAGAGAQFGKAEATFQALVFRTEMKP